MFFCFQLVLGNVTVLHYAQFQFVSADKDILDTKSMFLSSKCKNTANFMEVKTQIVESHFICPAL